MENNHAVALAVAIAIVARPLLRRLLMPKTVVPAFPTSISIFTGANASQPTQNPRVNTSCQLLYVYQQGFSDVDQEYVTKQPVLILIAAGTDIRGMECGGPLDIIQLPAGTGNWYIVAYVVPRWMGYAGSHLAVGLWPLKVLVPRDTALANPCTVPALPTAYHAPFAP